MEKRTAQEDRFGRVNRYVAAVLLTAAAVGLRLVLDSVLGPTPHPFAVLFCGAAVAAAWCGGFRAGLLSVALGTLALAYLFIEPKHNLGVEKLDDLVLLVSYIGTSLLGSVVCENLHAARRRLVREHKLRRGEQERFRLAADAVNGIIYEYDIPTGHVERTRGLYEVVGYRPDEVPPTAAWWHEQVHPDDREPARRRFEDAAASANSVVTEYRLRHKDGRWLHVEDQAVILKDGGRPVRMVGCTVDVTARKRAEEERHRTTATLDALIASAPVGVVLFDAEMRYRHVNGPLAEMNGLPAEAHLGKTVAEVVPALYESVKPLFERVLGEGEAVPDFVLEGETPKAPGVKRVWRQSWFPVAGAGGRPSGVGVIVQEITEQRRLERERENARQTLATLIERCPFGIYIVDDDFRIASLNAGSQDGAFANVRPAAGRPFDEAMRIIWPEPVATDCINIFRRTLDTGEPYYSKGFVNPRADIGRTEGYEWETHRITLPSGRHGVVCYYFDATRLRQAEESLRQSESRFTVALKNSRILVYTTDADLRYTWVYNPHPAFNSVDVLGRRDDELLPPEQAAPLTAIKLDVLNSGVGRRAEVAVEINGERAVYDLTVEPLRDGTGSVVGVTVAAMDVTDRKQAETVLKVSEVRYRRLFESAKDGILILDAHAATITDANPFMAEMLGYSQDEFVGKELWEIGLFKDVGASKAAMRELQDEGYIRYDDLPLETKAGRRINVEFVSNVYGENGETVIQCNVRDISDRKRLEGSLRQHADELVEADRHKDEFLATLAHELRNPLAPIRNGLQIMKLAGGNPDTVEKYRGMIERQVEQMTYLIDDLMDLSRIRGGKIVLQKARLKVSAVVQDAVDTSRPLIEERGHDLVVDVPPEPLYVDADRTRLAQVFGNLLNNAAKYTEPGGRIRVAVERQGGDVVVAVEDNGVGIPAHMLTRVFDMFAQVDRSLEKSQGGLGIGLNIVKRLAEMHDGSIVAESGGHGTGSRFVVRLPVVLTVTTDGPDDRNTVPKAEPARRRILVVDDNRDGVTSLAEMLGIMGNDTQTAFDGLEAVAVAEAFKPDVIFMDIGMPKLNGYEACRRIRGEPWGKNVVIVSCTGWGQEDDKRKSQEAGFDSHMTKPVAPAALEKLLCEMSAAKSFPFLTGRPSNSATFES